MTIELHAPQLIYLALCALGTGIALAKHGEPREGKHNFYWNSFAQALGLALLYWGGFFGPRG